MWWNSVDTSQIPRPARPRWVPRTPHWHSTTSGEPMDADGPPVSFLSVVAKSQKLERDINGLSRGATSPVARGATPSSPSRGARCPTHGTPSPIRCMSSPIQSTPSPLHRCASGRQGSKFTTETPQRRPKSAPSCFGASSVSPAKQKRSGRAGRRFASPKERRRPQSSPAMLRSHDGKRHMRHAHEDEFLQKIESCSVKRNMEVFKRENHVSKAKVDGVNFLEDTYYYDLKVLHNGGQRAKSATARRPESAGCVTRERSSLELSSSHLKSLDSSAAERIVELCGTMKCDLRRAFERCNVDLKMSNMDPAILQDLAAWMDSQGLELEDADAKKKRERQELLAGFGGFFKTLSVRDGFDTAEPTGTQAQKDPLAQLQQDAEAAAEVPGDTGPQEEDSSPQVLSPTSRKKAQRDGSKGSREREQRLGELVGFLMGCCGSVGAAFRHLDVNKDHTLDIKEWEEGMEKLGFTDDVSYVFRLLGKGPEDVATLDEVQALFDPFLRPTRRGK